MSVQQPGDTSSSDEPSLNRWPSYKPGALPKKASAKPVALKKTIVKKVRMAADEPDKARGRAEKKERAKIAKEMRAGLEARMKERLEQLRNPGFEIKVPGERPVTLSGPMLTHSGVATLVADGVPPKAVQISTQDFKRALDTVMWLGIACGVMVGLPAGWQGHALLNSQI